MNIQNIRVVLVETSHPGNIGAAARAMKTMGISDLRLVSPQHFPSAEATARAAGADSVLEQAKVCESLDVALEGCAFVLGTTARKRSLSWPVVNPREAGELLGAESMLAPIALVFGRERTGLTDEQILKCHQLVNIPSNPEYSSLNLAAAVQVLSYEIRVQHELGSEAVETEEREEPMATAENMAGYFEHLEKTLVAVGFLDPERPGRLIARLQRLYSRARPTLNEMNILRGILTETNKSVSKEALKKGSE